MFSIIFFLESHLLDVLRTENEKQITPTQAYPQITKLPLVRESGTEKRSYWELKLKSMI